MTQDELKLVLEALHKGKVACEWGQAHDHVQQIEQAMEAIKKALAQPKQETTNIERHEANVQNFLGAPQPEQEPVEWHEIVLNQKQFLDKMESLLAKTAAPPQPQQEPVAWMDADGKTFPFVWNVNSLGVRQGSKYLNESLTPLYTNPPQRTWVGLTDEEISKISQRLGIDHDDSWTDLKQAIEAKLKERNT